MKPSYCLLLVVSMLVLLDCSDAKIEALFSPKDKPTKRLIELIHKAKKSIHAAVYLLTDKAIAEALVHAKKQNKVDVILILDVMSTDGRYGKADYLVQNNVPVFIFDPKKNVNLRAASTERWFFDQIMHNKFVIIDGTTVWTGSFNWTVSASTHNKENILISTDRQICKQYEGEFASLLKTNCSQYIQSSKMTKHTSSLHHDVKAALESSQDEKVLLQKLLTILSPHFFALD